jgi:phospholipid/cholesterol/gamma-HCH transport system substrate-binding protein
MKSFRDRNPYAVGIISMLLIGALTGLAFMVGLLHLLENTYAMEATFTDGSGLRNGDDVKVAGVKVGRVTGVHAEPEDGLVRVTWVVNQGVEIGEDAHADVALETLLGSKYIRITKAAEGERLMEDLPRSERVIPHEECSGDGLCITRTTTPVELFDLTRNATEAIQETDNEKLNKLINQLATVTAGKRATITDLVNGLDAVAGAITEREGKLASLLDQADKLSATLASKDQQLARLIDSSRTVLQLLVDRRDQLSATLGEGSAAVQALARLIQVNELHLDAILDDLHPTLAVVNSNLPQLNRGLAYGGPGFFGQSLAGSHGPWLDIYVAALGPDIIGVLDDATDAVLP